MLSRNHAHCIPYYVLLCLTAAWLGCGTADPLGRQAIEGTVVVDGEPLKRGDISFIATDTSSGARSGAVISDGQFTIPQDKGLVPGKYVVRILATDSTQDEALEVPFGTTPMQRPVPQRIPPRYNTQSNIVKEVVAGEDNHFDFEISTR